MIKQFLVSAFAVMSVCFAGCSGFLGCDEQSPIFTEEDARLMVSQTIGSLMSSHRLSRPNGVRNVIVVDALDVSAAVDHENIAAVGRVFDMNLRKELTDSGLFFVYEADNCSHSAPKIAPQYRFKGKLSSVAMDKGIVDFMLSAAIADMSTGQVLWSKKVSVCKRVR